MSILKNVTLKCRDIKPGKLFLCVRKCHYEKINQKDMIRCKIGNREIVGFGFNGNPAYIDRSELPFPSIRFREFGPELMALREKEKGDWRTLTIEEKKCLYRASFCSTFAEMYAPSTEWKSTAGWVMFFCSLGIWLFVFTQLFVRKEAPSSFSKESRIAQYYRAIAINYKPFSTLARPPGAEKRIHPKNQKMLDEIRSKENSNQ